MTHESLPHDQHRPVNERFWRIVIPEVSVIAMKSMGALMGGGGLNGVSATALFEKLWNTPIEAVHQPKPNWRPKA